MFNRQIRQGIEKIWRNPLAHGHRERLGAHALVAADFAAKAAGLAIAEPSEAIETRFADNWSLLLHKVVLPWVPCHRFGRIHPVRLAPGSLLRGNLEQ